MILNEIIADRKINLQKTKNNLPLTFLKENHKNKKVVSIESLFENSPVIFCEIKFASPFKGEIKQPLNHIEIAGSYLRNGANAISVLTEPNYFKGKLGYISELREKYPQSFLLQKDFIFSEYQIYLAKFSGANAILLIVEALEPLLLKRLFKLAQEIGLNCLVEVHSKKSLAIAHEIGAKVIGVNNRDLNTMKVDIEHSFEMSRFFFKDRYYISESGLKKPEELKKLMNCGYKGFLVGTFLMKQRDPGRGLKKLRSLCK